MTPTETMLLEAAWVVGYLPIFSGDGYSYGGGATVTISGILTISLGEGRLSHAAAPLIASVPAMRRALEEIASHEFEEEMSEESRITGDYRYAYAEIIKIARAAISQPRGRTGREQLRHAGDGQRLP